jgi:dihydropyrimidine dehydrogenase (NAD+) subunit PreA
MFDPAALTGADISTTFCGKKLRTPFILSSCPLGYGAEGLIRAHNAGCGAVVTKTIRIARAINPCATSRRLATPRSSTVKSGRI